MVYLWQAELENLIPDRDTLKISAEEQETDLEQETRKASMYDHMQTRAKNGAEDASKEVTHGLQLGLVKKSIDFFLC